jgi:chemotaxis protein MotB
MRNYACCNLTISKTFIIMKQTNAKRVYFYLVFIIVLISCVPPKYFSEVQSDRDKCKNERQELINENEKMTVENTELKANWELANESKKREAEKYLNDLEDLKNLTNSYNQLDKRYKELQASHEALVNGSSSEAKNLMGKLDNAQRDLYQREDQLNQLSAKLDKEKAELTRLKDELDVKNKSLIKLQNILARKDSAVDALKQKVSIALLGFENQGLTITKKNGKVYVSLDEKLLFGSGSTEVDPRGKSALNKLARVLEQNRDINITIEGHTDDVAVVPGAKYKDNWDLSVQRATSIIRILLDGSTINPKRLTASGRGEFLPVDPHKTEDARQKNRRTEIILTPNLDELLNILDKN